MALGPEQSLLNEQYVQLLQRQSFVDPTVTATIAANAAGGIATAGVTIDIPPGQAVRIVRAEASIQVAPDFGSLVLNTASIWVFGGPGTANTFWAFPAVGLPCRPGGNGLAIAGGETELFFFNDYLEEGGIPPGLVIQVLADLQNPDAAPHDAFAQGSYLIERYLLRQGIGGVGFPGFKAE